MVEGGQGRGGCHLIAAAGTGASRNARAGEMCLSKRRRERRRRMKAAVARERRARPVRLKEGRGSAAAAAVWLRATRILGGVGGGSEGGKGGRGGRGGGVMPAEEDEEGGELIGGLHSLVQVIHGDEGRHAHAAAHDGLHNADGRVGERYKREGPPPDVAGDAEEPALVGEVGGEGGEGEEGQVLAGDFLQRLAKAENTWCYKCKLYGVAVA